ncbi:MAG TPA: hypothetical protein VHY19_16130 [Steroidobacteraceae bacterium]|jgi:hypothetical protein|nr:hypothetical protein [Steroidobacteraceae bacterium]
MNATTKISHTAELRLATPSIVKVGTCAALSLIITLLTASVIGQATGAASLAQSVSVGAPAMTVSAR